jgi:hypothetical protein
VHIKLPSGPLSMAGGLAEGNQICDGLSKNRPLNPLVHHHDPPCQNCRFMWVWVKISYPNGMVIEY